MNVPLLEVRDLEVWYALDGGGHNHAVTKRINYEPQNFSKQPWLHVSWL